MWWSKRKPSGPSDGEPISRDPIDGFWAFWKDSRDAIAVAIENQTLDEWTDPISAAVHAIHSDLGWDLGKGEQAQHYMCISAEGDMELRVTCERWLSRAPGRDATWEYRAAKPGGSLTDCVLSFAGVELDLADSRILVERDEDRERVHVTYYHPQLSQLEPNQQRQVTYIVLDGTLGEDDVERWIGAIDVSVEPLESGLTFAELDAAIAPWREAREPRWTMLSGKTPAGLPVLVIANLALKRLDHLLMETHLQIEMACEGALNDGLPDSEELAVLQQLEAELCADLGHDAVHIATVTTGGLRTNHFHIAGQGPALARVHAWERAHPERRIQVTCELDTTWEVCERW